MRHWSLAEKSPVAVVERNVKVLCLAGQEGILPGRPHGWGRLGGIKWTGTNGRAPEKGHDAWGMQSRCIRRERRRGKRGIQRKRATRWRVPVRGAGDQQVIQACKNVARGSESRPDHKVPDIV